MDIKEIKKTNLRFIIDQYFDGIESKLAMKLGKNPSQISRIFSSNAKIKRNIGKRLSREIESIIGLPKNWMEELHDLNMTMNFHEPKLIAKIPVASLKNFMNGENIPTEDPKEFAYTVGPVGQNCFAIINPEDTTNEIFPVNTKLILDPDILPYHKALVLVQLQKNAYPIIRQLLMEGHQFYLRALNPIYPLITVSPELKFLGVLVGIDYSEAKYLSKE